MKAEVRILSTLWILLFVTPYGAWAGRIMHVDAGASGGGDGASWAAAFKYLQDALAAADANDEIRVAQGTYVPDQNSVTPAGSGDRGATFQLISGVAIYGGYAGYGQPDPNDRDIEAFETILSGDLHGDDVVSSSPEQLLGEASRSENCYHVVTGNWTDETGVLDGFTITAGHATGIGYPKDCGAGMFNFEPCNPTIVNCTFKNNCAKYSGGGVYNKYSSPTITDCTFADNSASCGAGSHNFLSCLKIVNCIFTGNFASTEGGGMFNDDVEDFPPCSPTVRNCMFVGNRAIYDGGGMFNYHSAPEVSNCTFAGNSSEHRGGAIGNAHGGDPLLNNCTFVENSADEYGGGIWSKYGRPELSNCILWDNMAGEEGPQIGLETPWSTPIKYSCLQGGQMDIYVASGSGVEWGPGNIDADPCLVDVFAGDYHLKSQAGRWASNDGRWTMDEVTSPCIDAGDPNSEWTAELWPHGKCINMGAFGGTPQASMSESSLGNRADLNNSNRVDFADVRLLADKWLKQQPLLPEDLDRNGSVDSEDFAVFGRQWLWEQ